MAQQQYPKLKYRIVSCSSEEPDYPVQELLTQSPQSKGWQSARFCDYPQEITIQFMTPVRLKQVQFLSHQSKISSKIDLYVYLPDPSSVPQNAQIKYKKLGYLSLDSNERTGYQARELKSVYIDASCMFMKLIIHQEHSNKYNLFKQVGLIAVSCFGEEMGAQRSQQPQEKQYYNEIQFETQFDQMTLDRLKQLEKNKERAIQAEDYEEAKMIKEAIDRLKQIGIQLRQLDERKNIAVQNEDYDSARIIKAEIDKIRNTIAPPQLAMPHQQQQQFDPQMMQQQQYEQNQMNQYGNQQQQDYMQQQQMQQHQQQMQQQQYQQDPQYQEQMQQQQQMNNFNQQQQNQQQEQIYQQEQEQFLREQQQFNQDKQQQQWQQEQDNNRNTFDQNQGKNHDSQVIPAMKKNKQQNQFDDGETPGQSNNNNMEQEPDEFTSKNYKLAEPLIPVLGEPICRQLFSKSWQTKQSALQALQNPSDLLQSDQQQQFTALMGACSNTVTDKIAQVVIASIQLFESTCSSYRSLSGNPKGELATYIDNVLITLVDKIGESNKKISEPAEKALLSAGNNGMVQTANIVQLVSKGQNLPKKLTTSHKHIAARLNLLGMFVQKFQINNKQVPLDPVIEFATKQIAHQNQDVRNASVKLISNIHASIGEGALRPYLNNIPQQQMELLEEVFSGQPVGKSKKQQSGVGSSQQKEVVTTNIGGGGGAGGGAGGKGNQKTRGGKVNKNNNENLSQGVII